MSLRLESPSARIPGNSARNKRRRQALRERQRSRLLGEMLEPRLLLDGGLTEAIGAAVAYESYSGSMLSAQVTHSSAAGNTSESGIPSQYVLSAGESAGIPEINSALQSIDEAIDQLQASPTSAPLCARVEFLLGQLNTRLGSDESLSSFVTSLQPLRTAAAACDTPALLSLAPAFFSSLTNSLNVLATEQFTAALTPAVVDLAPGQGKSLTLTLNNTGTNAITLNLSLGNLPAGVAANLGQSQVNVPAGGSAQVPVTLTQTLASASMFSLSVTAAATVARHTATASIAVRPATADVLSVSLTPGAVEAGDPIGVIAQIFNTANVARSVLAQIQILDTAGTILNTLPTQSVTLNPAVDTIGISLGQFSTTGLEKGVYKVRVSLRTTDGDALPGRSAEQSFLVGVPISGLVTASPNNLPPGNSNVTTTISLTNEAEMFALPGGKVVVAHDESTLSENGFNQAPVDARQFVRNITNFFGGAGNYLVYSDNFSLTGAQLAATMQAAGNTWTVSTAPKSLEQLQAFDAVFVGGFAVDSQLLTDYVNGGGNVYLCAGSGVLGHFGNVVAEAAAWNPFLANFDLQLESVANGLGGILPVSSAHPLLAGIAGLYQDVGMDVRSLGGRGKVIELLAGHEMVSIYEGTAIASLPPVVPSAQLHEVTWVGGASGFWDVAANWLDTTSNTSHVPTANDYVTLDATGLTITVRTGTSNAHRLEVVAGSTLAITGGTLSLAEQSMIDGSLNVSGGELVLGADLHVGGDTLWTGGIINVMGHIWENEGTLTIGSLAVVTSPALHSRDAAGGIVPHGTLMNHHEIVLQGNGSFTLRDAAAVTNEGDFTVTGNSTISSSSGSLKSPLNNIGTLTFSPPGTAIISATINNVGELVVDSGTLNVNGYLNNAGMVMADGATINLSVSYSPIIVSGSYAALMGGTISLPTATTITTNQANLRIDGMGSQILGLQNLTTNGGAITVTNDADLSIVANVINLGAITVGPASTLAITGRFTQEAEGSLDLQLGGTPASGLFGQLTTTQQTTLGGILRSDLVNGYSPTLADSFTVVMSVGSTGTFAGQVLPATGTIGFSATTSANSIVLNAVASTAAPTTTVVSLDNPHGHTHNSAIPLTATVTSAAGTPTGFVQFQLDGVSVGAPAPLINGVATINQVVHIGMHQIGAVFLSSTGTFASSAAAILEHHVDPEEHGHDDMDTDPHHGLNDVPFYYALNGTTGGVSQANIQYDGESLTIGPGTGLFTNADAEALLYLPNGNLLVGGDTIRQVSPLTGQVVGPVINTTGDHFTLDPNGTKVWTSRERNTLVEIPLDPFGTFIDHPVTGSDTQITQIAFDYAGNAYYVNGFNFGRIDLNTFVTTRLLSDTTSADHSLQFDPHTGHFLLIGNQSISQYDPVANRIVSLREVGATLRHAKVDGDGHLFITDLSGQLTIVDCSETGLIGDPRNFVGTHILADEVRDLTFIYGMPTETLHVTVDHTLPDSGYFVNAGSLSPAGIVFTTNVLWEGHELHEDDMMSPMFEFLGQVSIMRPGEVRLLSQGTTVTAVLTAPNGSALPITLQLPAVTVSANHVLELTTLTQSVGRNQTVPVQVTLTNPLPTAQNYLLSADGLSGLNGVLPSSVLVSAGQTVNVTMQVVVPADALPGSRTFRVIATTAAGAADSAEGTLTVTDDVAVETSALHVDLTPAQATGGQGTSTNFVLRVTDVGDTTETVNLSGQFPAGVAGAFSQSSIVVPPGVGNFREVQLTLTPARGTAVGNVPFQVFATAASDVEVQDEFAGSLNIVNAGVELTFVPLSGPPGSTFQLIVRNTATVTDTFDLALSGPGALVATLSQPSITLTPGAALVVNVTIAGIDFAAPPALDLIAIATSRNNGAVKDETTASIIIPPALDDFGDAPASYGTTLAANGARHNAQGPFLGTGRDAEEDGTPSATAFGDDTTGDVDDENGVSLPGLLVAGSCDCSGTGLGHQIVVSASGVGFLDAWIDFNRDGDFDANEKIASGLAVMAGPNTLDVTVPSSASAGTTFARFRISSTGGLGPTGAADDGEVEDYALQIFNPNFGSTGIIADPANAAAHVLYIKGTNFSDAIVVRQTSPGVVTVFVSPQPSITKFSLASFDRIVVCGLSGNDSIVIESSITKPSIIYGDEGNDAISGGSGNDILFGGPGVDAIAGNAGDDQISGGAGVDSMVGGPGIDRLVETVGGAITLSSAQLRVGSEPNPISQFELATLVGGNASDSFNLGGWPFPATIDGGGGMNTIVDSGNANFVLTPGGLVRTLSGVSRGIALLNIHNANLTGGSGANSFDLTAWPLAATLSGGAGTDTFSVSGDVDYTLNDGLLLRPNMGMIRLVGFENATLNAGASDNTFRVGDWTKAATLNGNAGQDKVVAAGNHNFTLSNTTLARSGRGTFTLSSIEQADLMGGAGNNVLNGAAFTGELKLDGVGSNDTLTAGSGSALLIGGAGNDVLLAGSGRAVLMGGLGVDRLTGGSNDDLLIDGQTAHDASSIALALLLAEWTSANSYADRVAHLTGTAGGLNGSTHLGGNQVIHDSAIDQLLGGAGVDLFFAKLSNPALDVLSDKVAGEASP